MLHMNRRQFPQKKCRIRYRFDQAILKAKSVLAHLLEERKEKVQNGFKPGRDDLLSLLMDSNIGISDLGINDNSLLMYWAGQGMKEHRFGKRLHTSCLVHLPHME